MTNIEYFRTLVKSNGPKGRLILKLSNGSEMNVCGNWSIHAQMDMFRDRVLLTTSWTEIWISLDEVESVLPDGNRIVARMKTGAIAWIPTST